MNNFNIIEIDNVLSDKFSNDIKETLAWNYFPWYFIPSSVPAYTQNSKVPYYKIDGFDCRDLPSMRHNFIIKHEITSDFSKLIHPILDAISQTLKADIHIDNATSNLIMPIFNNEEQYNYPHIDRKYEIEMHDEWEMYTAIYYVNDVTGDTLLFNETLGNETEMFSIRKRVSPKQNKLVIFDSRIYHSAPTYSNGCRFVINFNFLCRKQ